MPEVIDIATLNDDVEAMLLEADLKEEGIPHFMVSYWDAAYDGLFQMQHGWGAVRAPRTSRDRILGILSNLREERNRQTAPESA
jgi:hypothetical protein